MMGACIDELDMVWVFGSNKEGELGVGDYTARFNPYPLISLQGKSIKSVALGGNFAFAVSSNPMHQQSHEVTLKQIDQTMLTSAGTLMMKDSLNNTSLLLSYGHEQRPMSSILDMTTVLHLKKPKHKLDDSCS